MNCRYKGLFDMEFMDSLSKVAGLDNTETYKEALLMSYQCILNQKRVVQKVSIQQPFGRSLTYREFSRWVEVFHDKQMTAALLERVTHKAHIIL